MAPKFSAIEDEKLINAISSHRAIYDSENVDYKNQHIKDNIWEVIAKETARCVDDCKERWKCIRDSYQKIKKSQKTTTGQPAIKRPKWSLYELLSFLESVPTERSSVNTLQPIEEESIGTDTYNIDFEEQHENSANEVLSQNNEDERASTIQSTPSTQSTTKASFKNRQQRTSDSKLLEDLKKRSAERSSFMTEILKDEDEVDIFMRSIAVQVKKLPPQLIAEAKVGILSLVNRLQFRDTLQPTPSSLHSSSNYTQLSYDFPNVSPDTHSQFSFPFTRSHSDSDSNFIDL